MRKDALVPLIVVAPWIILFIGFLMIGASLATAPVTESPSKYIIATPAVSTYRVVCPTVPPATIEALPVGETITVRCESH